MDSNSRCSNSDPSGLLCGAEILVTGGNGYIGSHTVLQLLSAGASVVIIDNLVNSDPECRERMQNLSGKSIPLHRISLMDYPSVFEVFSSHRSSKGRSFDAVIHFAGLKAVGESCGNPLEYYDNNIVGSINLLKAMKAFQCKSIVFSSSCTVYGHSDTAVSESFPLSPINPYGRSKLMVEDILRDISKSDSEFSAVLLRYFNPIGAHPSGDIGEAPNGIPTSLLPYVLQVAVGRLPHIQVFGNDWPTHDGTGVRDYLHVEDVAKGHISAIVEGIFNRKKDSNSALSNCEAYNLGMGKGVSVLELIDSVERACGKELKRVIVKRRPGDAAVAYADPSKAQKYLKWKAEKSLDDCVQSAWKWQSAHPWGYASPPTK